MPPFRVKFPYWKPPRQHLRRSAALRLAVDNTYHSPFCRPLSQFRLPNGSQRSAAFDDVDSRRLACLDTYLACGAVVPTYFIKPPKTVLVSSDDDDVQI